MSWHESKTFIYTETCWEATAAETLRAGGETEQQDGTAEVRGRTGAEHESLLSSSTESLI